MTAELVEQRQLINKIMMMHKSEEGLGDDSAPISRATMDNLSVNNPSA